MPSDHVIEDEPGFVAAVRRAAEVARTGKLVLFGITPNVAAHRLRLHPARRGARRASPGPSPSTPSPRSPTRTPPPPTWRPAPTPGTAASSCSPPAPSWRSWPASSPPSWRRPGRRSAEAREDLGFLRLDAKAFAQAPTISIDYAVMERTECRRRAAGRHRLERRRLLVVAVGARTHDAQGNAVRGDALLEDTTELLRPFRAGAGRHHRRQGPRHRRHARCAAGGRPRPRAGRVGHRRAPEAGRPQGARRSTCAATGRGATSRR